MSKKIIALALFFVTGSSQAILLERSAQGQYNHSSSPVVNQKEAYEARIHPQAPRANTGFKHNIYTYDNNVSEYLRDNLNLPKEQSNYALQAASYLKTPQQLPPMNSTFPTLEKAKGENNSKVKYKNLHKEDK